MDHSQEPLLLSLTAEERILLLEAVRNQREFAIEDGYEPEYIDKFIHLTKTVEEAMGLERS